MSINPKHLKDRTNAEITLMIFLSEPDKRLEIVNRFFTPVEEPWQAILSAEFATVAAEAFQFMENKPPYKFLNDEETGWQLLERATGYKII